MYDILSANTDDAFVFDSTLHVKVQDDIHRSSRLRLQLRHSHGRMGMSHGGLFLNDGVHLQLFDETDPYLFYSAEISDDVFQRLKIQQHLLVDFASFPQRLVELLQMCANEESLSAPRYQCELQLERATRSGLLHITEVNGFKKLVHLTVRLSQADESQVRKSIVSRLARLKHEKDRLEAEVKSMEGKLAEKQTLAERQINAQRSQMEKMRSAFENDMKELRERFETELRRDKDDINREMSDRVQRLFMEKTDAESTFKERLRNLESEIQSGQLARASLEARVREAQSEIQQAQLRLAHEKETNRILQSRLDSLSQNDLDQENAELRMKLAQLKVDLETMRTDLCRANMDRKRLEENLNHKQGQIERREAGIKTMSDDIVKANEIIQKLQTEIKSYHAKLKVRADVIMKQEELIESKDKEISSLRDRQNVDIEDHSKENRGRIQQLEKQVAHKDSVIQWLNKKLNELQGHKIDTPLLKMPSPLTDHNGHHAPLFGRNVINKADGGQPEFRQDGARERRPQ